jgi:hypothetical protein
VSLAIVLLDSALPGFRPYYPTHWDSEWVWVKWYGSTSPVGLDLYTAHTADYRENLTGISLRLTAVAALIGVAWWVLRAKLSPGWVAVMAIAVTVLATVGPIRQAEALSPELDRCWPLSSGLRPRNVVPWTGTGLALYLEARAWAGYSFRAFWFALIAILAAVSLRDRGRRWVWTEWAAFAAASVLACCWVYNEFAGRPSFDWTARMVVLGTWLVVLGVSAGFVNYAWARLGRVRARARSDAGAPV